MASPAIDALLQVDDLLAVRREALREHAGVEADVPIPRLQLHAERRVEGVRRESGDAPVHLAVEHRLLDVDLLAAAVGEAGAEAARDVGDLRHLRAPVEPVHAVHVGDDAADVVEAGDVVGLDDGVERVLAQHVAERQGDPAADESAVLPVAGADGRLAHVVEAELRLVRLLLERRRGGQPAVRIGVGGQEGARRLAPGDEVRVHGVLRSPPPSRPCARSRRWNRSRTSRPRTRRRRGGPRGRRRSAPG